MDQQYSKENPIPLKELSALVPDVTLLQAIADAHWPMLPLRHPTAEALIHGKKIRQGKAL